MNLGNLSDVDWVETIKLLVARGFFSALVIVLVLSANAQAGQGFSWGGAIGFIALWTVGGGVLVFLANMALRVVGFILYRTGLPGGALLMWIFIIGYWILSIAFVLGDPFVWLLMRAVPGLLPVLGFNFFNLAPLILVRRGGEASFDLGFSLPASWRRGDGLR